MKGVFSILASAAILSGMFMFGAGSDDTTAREANVAPVFRAKQSTMFQTGPFGRTVRIKPRAGETVVLRVVAPTVARSLPGGGRVIRTIPTAVPYGNDQMQLRVLRQKNGAVDPATGAMRVYYLVHIPFRRNKTDSSNKHVGWVASDRVTPIVNPYHLYVSLASRRVTLKKRGKVAGTWKVVVGRPSTPTPSGEFAVYGKSRRQNHPTAGDGVLTFAYSKVIQNFDGQNGMVAFHGHPNGTLGTARSLGCVRMSDAVIRNLVKIVPIGTPVTVK